MMRTAWSAVKIAILLYLIPFFFIYDMGLLGRAPPLDVIRVAVTGLIGVLAIGAGAIGRFTRTLSSVERFLFLGGGIALLYPNVVTELAGAAALFLAIIYQWRFPYREPLRPLFNLIRRGGDKDG